MTIGQISAPLSAAETEKKTGRRENPLWYKTRKSRALIIYTGRKDSKSAGYRAAETVRTHLKHFRVEAELVPSRRYSRRLMGSYKWIFYVGASRERLGADLKNDLGRTSKRVVWINENLRQMGREFSRENGFSVSPVRETAKLINYKDAFLPKKDKSVNRVNIINPKRNMTYAWAFISKTKKTPYILKSRNYWYVADNPFSRAREGDGYLAFADILHNVIEDHPHERKAMIRIDGVNPKTDPQELRTVIDFLYINRLPFAISVTPVYKKRASAAALRLRDKKELVKALKGARTRGGVIVLNGYTHQDRRATGTESEFGARPGQSVGSIQDRTAERLKRATAELKESGLRAKVWHTPFYQASPADYQIFRRYFSNAFERSSEPPVPYRIGKNEYGQRMIPENLGSIRSNKGPKSEHLAEKAWRMRVVRDAYAGFSISPETPLSELAKTLKEMEAMNYNFISPFQALDMKTTASEEPFFMDYALFQVSFRTEHIMTNLGWALLPVVFFSYYLIIFGLSRRIRPRPKEDNPDYFFVFIVPALNEGKVIKRTIEKLAALTQRNYMVLAMNDNSSDNTESEILSVRSDKVKLFNVKPSNCRRGKGNVLNIAYRYVLNDSGLTDRYPVDNIIIGVVDSDGGVDPDILPSVTPYFKEKRSASVQTAVRIENNDQNIWTKWQDFEFRVFTFLFQSAREQMGSVGLGGNGQFIRLSALTEFGDAPWTSCLTEDLDIGIRLILNDWRNHFCSTSYVSQQGVPEFWPLVKQRTRWFQGHVQCWRHLGPIALKRMPLLAKIDITYYLLSISLALFIVPANFVMAVQAGYLAANPDLFRLLAQAFGGKIFAYWYFIYFGAMPIFTFAYWQTKKQSFLRAAVMSHLFLFVSLVWLIAGYLAIFRAFRKTTNWNKTVRYAEPEEEQSRSGV